MVKYPVEQVTWATSITHDFPAVQVEQDVVDPAEKVPAVQTTGVP